jgi:2-dehydro-3-deoxygluconokinase
MSREPTVFTFGEVMARIEPTERLTFGQALPGTIRLGFGGAEANVAVSLALMGVRAAFVSVLPKNPIADACVQELRGLGVETRHILRSDAGRMGIYFSEAGANQRPSVVTYDRAGSAMALAPPDAVDWPALLAAGDWLHVTGITPALSENAAQAALRAAQAAKSKGCKVSVDLNFRSKLWRWREGRAPAELAAEVMGGILPHADIVVGNEEDAEKVLGIRAAGADVEAGRIEHERYTEVGSEIVRRFPNVAWVGITLRGSISASHNTWAGMLLADRQAHFAPVDESGAVAPYQITHIVDRVGAGDSFVAGLILGLLEGMTPERAVAFAVAASCLKHSIPGDYNRITRKQVEALLGGSASGRVQR